MSDNTDLLHVARPRECTVQQLAPQHATGRATTRASTSLKAASMLVLARNKACNNRATSPEKAVQQTTPATPPIVASEVAPDLSFTAKLAELNGLIARVARYHGFADVDASEARAVAVTSIDEALRCYRVLA